MKFLYKTFSAIIAFAIVFIVFPAAPTFAASSSLYAYVNNYAFAHDDDWGYTYGTAVKFGAKPDSLPMPKGTEVVLEVYGCNGDYPTYRLRRKLTKDNITDETFSSSVTSSVLGKNPTYKVWVISPDGRTTFDRDRLPVAADDIRPCNLNPSKGTTHFDNWNAEWLPKTYFSLPVDTDNDGLFDDEETARGTDPNNPDTDGDTLLDGEEVNTYKTNPLTRDTDNDTLSDNEELAGASNLYDGAPTNPLSGDTDKDGLSDKEENLQSTSPTMRDTDGDAISDGDEVLNGTDPKDSTSPSEDVDSDGDGITDRNEATGIENVNFNNEPTSPVLEDTDNDGLTDGDEITNYFTNPNSSDTDNDGVSDFDEVTRGSDPLDMNSPVQQKIDSTWVKKFPTSMILKFKKHRALVNAVQLTSKGKKNAAKVSYTWKIAGKKVHSGRTLILKRKWNGKKLSCIILVKAAGYTPFGRTYIRVLPKR